MFTKTRSLKQRLLKHRSLSIGIASMILLVAVAYASLSNQSRSIDQGNKSAVIDQLSNTYPNTTFRFTLDSMFHANGWIMSYYQGSGFSDTVDFYRSLPQQEFKIIILRAHTAMNPQTGTLALFTSEIWNDMKASTTYLTDIIDGRLASVRVTDNSTTYFGITPNFIKAMDGNFQNTIIITMGCDGLTNTRMAEAFIEKGAKAYVGWTGPVSVQHTDVATQQLLKHLITEKQTIATAITETLSEVGKDPDYGSILSYFPVSSGQSKLSP